jgi:hypothetical protein
MAPSTTAPRRLQTPTKTPTKQVSKLLHNDKLLGLLNMGKTPQKTLRMMLLSVLRVILCLLVDLALLSLALPSYPIHLL